MTSLLHRPPSIDDLEDALAALPPAEMPVRHHFTPGLYCREIHMPAGTMATSMEHKTEHPFILSAGVVEVIDSHGNAELFQAPHFGITKPGTKRVLRVLADAVWTTFHATGETDVVKIGEAILVPSSRPDREGWRREVPQTLTTTTP
jgi:hypothetical protein